VRQARLLRRSHVEILLKGLPVQGLRLERLSLEGLLLEGLLLEGLLWAPGLWLAALLLVWRQHASLRLAVLVERLRRLLVEAEHLLLLLLLRVLERLRQGREMWLLLLLMLLRLHQGRVGEAGWLLEGLPERSRSHSWF
jgi:hypothetical protein